MNDPPTGLSCPLLLRHTVTSKLLVRIDCVTDMVESGAVLRTQEAHAFVSVFPDKQAY